MTRHIKRVFDSDSVLRDVWLEGEISNVRRVSSGHWYWTVKDDGSAIQCVLFRSAAAFQTMFPKDGEQFLLHGNVSVYAPQGRYQLYVDHCEPVGRGDLHREFERLKGVLQAEGLFDRERKKTPPKYPRRIGVVTSADAAALRDVYHVVRRRWPHGELVLAATPVQGDSAPAGIRSALRAAVRAGVDVIILARGGGSLEDLWAFNNEGVVRAIAACRVPIVSGVGHETDFTLTDFVADVRAATPSVAAEIATPDGQELAQWLDRADSRMSALLARRMSQARASLRSLESRLESRSPARRVAAATGQLGRHEDRLGHAVTTRFNRLRAEVRALEGRLQALSPLSTLDRGFAHVSLRDGATVRRVSDVSTGAALVIRVSDGRFGALATDVPEPSTAGRHDTPADSR